MLSKYANTRDNNEPEIIEALEKIGASVEQLDAEGVPDLLVGYRCANYLLEVKNPERRGSPIKQLTAAQVDFFARWRGQRAIVRNINEALEAIGAVSRIVGRDCRG